MPAVAFNPSVIEPLSSNSSMAAAAPTSQPVTRVVYQAKTPEILKTAPLPPAITDITAMSTSPQPAPQPAVLLPDISKMSNDLITSGQLLGDIPVAEGEAAPSVLDSLQPGADPNTAKNSPIPLTIQLAKSPITTDTMTRSGSWSWGPEMVKPLILGLSLLTVVVALAGIWLTANQNTANVRTQSNTETPRTFDPDTVPAATVVK